MNKILLYLSERPWILPLIIFFVLAFGGAIMHPLWGDEAETALFAKNILTSGLPKGWDGVNIMGINNGVVLDKHLINHTSPWGQYYLTALSFALFGPSTFSARLPFIIVAAGSIVALYYFALTLFKEKRIALLTVFILCLSVGFILFAFQDRYYSLTIIGGIGLIYSSLYLDEKNKLPKALFILSGVVFFYANYVSFVAFFVSAFLSYLLYLYLEKKSWVYIRKFIFNYSYLGLIIMFCTVPWYLIMKPFESRGGLVLPHEFFKEIPEMMIAAYAPYNLNMAFPILFLVISIGIIIWSIWKGKRVTQFLLVLLIPFIYLSMMVLFTTISVVDTAFVHNRYTVVVFPFFALASAYILLAVWNFKKHLGYIALFLFIFTNLFSFQKPRSFIFEYLGEVIHPYKTPDEEVAQYLRIHAQKGDTAFVNLDRDHEPLIFQLKDQIRFVNRVSLINTRIFPENRDLIPRYIYDFRGNPDWVILFSKRGNDGSFFTFDSRDVPREINLQTDYTETKLNIFFSDMTRPEFAQRSFTEIKPTGDDFVYVYKLKK